MARARNPYSRSELWFLRCAIGHRSSRVAGIPERSSMLTAGFLQLIQQICPTGKSPKTLSRHFNENILIFRSRKSGIYVCRPAPQRGGSRSSRNAGWDAMDAGSAQDGRTGAYGEVVWSWTPSAGVDGGYQAWYAGESTKEAVKTIARGMPGVSGVTVVTTLVWFVFYPHARLRAHRAPGIPCAL